MTPGKFEDLKRDVIDAGLCTRCGSCVGVCPDGALSFPDPLGDCLPAQSAPCPSCEGVCHDACSGLDVPFPRLNRFVFGRVPENALLGNYNGLWVGHATDGEVRRRAASGGIITAVLTYLLERGQVDGAVVLATSMSEPWRSEVRIVRDPRELAATQQSRYAITPVNTILRDLEKEKGRFAYVGLPCQVHSLRKLQEKGHPAAAKVSIVVGTYCGNALHFEAVRSFLRSHGVDRLEDVASLSYRAGEWPGRMEVVLHSGRTISLAKFHANYLIPFYMMDRCLLCTDLTNEFADIAAGDAWAPIYEERGKGWSLVVGRTTRGVQVLEAMVREKRLSLQPVPETEAVDMHSHMLDFKKRGAFLRMERRRARGEAVPRYGFAPTGIPWKRRLFEGLLGMLFWICRQPVARWCLERVPIAWVGGVFSRARLGWKRITRGAKRGGLRETVFEMESGDA